MNTHDHIVAASAAPRDGPAFDAPPAAGHGNDSAPFSEFQATIDRLAGLVALVDIDGAILAENDHWRRSVEQRLTWAFRAGANYRDALQELIDSGDKRIPPILQAFLDVSAGTRESFQCVYIGSGILSGHDYNVHLSRLELGGRWYVLVNAEDLTEVNALKRQRRRVGSQVLRAQEDERRRIARELHDSTSQLLVALQLNLMSLEGVGDGPKSEELIADCKKVLQDVHCEIRSFSYIAHPPSLLDNGLGKALEAMCKGFASRTGLDIDLQVSDLGQASASVEAALYRLAQEALANIHRHAAAERASVRLVGTQRCLHLMIADDGVGFDQAEISKRHSIGVGMLGMAERVRNLGGRFSIHRAPANGTIVRASLPRSKPGPGITASHWPQG